MPGKRKSQETLTKKWLDALKPRPGGQFDVMDTVARHLGIRVYPTGKKVFFVRLVYRKKARRILIGEYPSLTLQEARKDEQEKMRRLGRGEDPEGHSGRHGLAFEALVTEYLAHAKRRLKLTTYQKESGAITKDLAPAWNKLPARAVRRGDVAKVIDGIVARGSPVQANRTRAVAHRIFRYAVEREIVEYNPVSDLRPPHREKSRETVLTATEIHDLWTAMVEDDTDASTILQLILATGQRPGEVMACRWEDLSGSWWSMPGETRKTGRSHRVFLSPIALELIASVKKAGEYLFRNPRKKTRPVQWLGGTVRRLRVASKVEGWSAHDLRRTCATMLGGLGVAPHVIGAVLGHQRRDVTAVYDRARRERETEAALTLWGAELAKIIADRDYATAGRDATHSATSVTK